MGHDPVREGDDHRQLVEEVLIQGFKQSGSVTVAYPSSPVVASPSRRSSYPATPRTSGLPVFRVERVAALEAPTAFGEGRADPQVPVEASHEVMPSSTAESPWAPSLPSESTYTPSAPT